MYRKLTITITKINFITKISLVGWSLTSLFSTNTAISEMKGQGWKVSDILTSTLAVFLFSSHPKRERDQKAHLNYYACAYNRGAIAPQD